MPVLIRVLRSPFLVYSLIAFPGLYLVYPFLQGDPTVLADPAKYLLEYAGKTATILFITVLSLTPLARIFPRSRVVNALNRHRRKIGVSSFVYALFHLFFYAVYEGGFHTLPENLTKPFILSGATAFLILFVLASTSTDWAVRRLGGRPWKRLHRSVYLAAFLILYHQAAQEKVGAVQTVYFFAPLGLLQLIRIGKYWRSRINRRR